MITVFDRIDNVRISCIISCEAISISLTIRCVAELAHFDGKDGKPIYISADGFVFDVSSRPDFYGPGAGYSCFSGK